MDEPNKHQMAQLFGMSNEPLSYALVNLKTHMKVALTLTSKLGNALNAYNRFLISLISLDGASDNVSKPELGEVLTKALELGGCDLAEKKRLSF